MFDVVLWWEQVFQSFSADNRNTVLNQLVANNEHEMAQKRSRKS